MGRIAQARIHLLEYAIAKLDQIADRVVTTGEPAHLALGRAGEDAAFFYLRRKGYVVVARRWSSGDVPGDADLIAWQGSLLCFIEVKTRSAHDRTPAEAAVNGEKRRVLCRLARRYIRQLPRKDMPQVRFDVISVYLVSGAEPEFMHFEAAFSWSDLNTGG